MKKFYLTAVIAVLGFIGKGYSQYVATNSGNWSNNATWAPGVKPPAICNACTITINANVAVNLDASVFLRGGSVLYIGSDATSPASLLITGSGSSGFTTGHNVLLDGTNSGNKVVLTSAQSSLVAISADLYDGIFSNFFSFTSVKLVGNPGRNFVSNTLIDNPILPATRGSVLIGPATLNSQNVLPILLGDFNATFNGSAVQLDWTTLIEINGDHFDIERSANAKDFNKIGEVAAAGNTETKVSYSFTDNSPSSVVNYYRLKMVDRDGKYKYSEVKVVRGSTIEGYSVFPNPARDYVNVTVGADAPGELTFRFINNSGQVLQERKFSNAAGTTVSLPVGSYPAGSYLLMILGNDGSRVINKVLVAR